MKDSFFKELEHVSINLQNIMKILLQDFNARVNRENIFKQTVVNEDLHKIIIDNRIFLVNFATSKNLTVKSTVPTSQHS
jgi:hypothetical protein